MTQSEFLERLRDMLQTDCELAPQTPLNELEEWDSLAIMVLIAFFDREFGLQYKYDEILGCATPQALMRLAEGNMG